MLGQGPVGHLHRDLKSHCARLISFEQTNGSQPLVSEEALSYEERAAQRQARRQQLKTAEDAIADSPSATAPASVRLSHTIKHQPPERRMKY